MVGEDVASTARARRGGTTATSRETTKEQERSGSMRCRGPGSNAPTSVFFHGTIEGMEPGRTLGHEFVGVVDEVGPEVAVEDRVAIPFKISCGSCGYCRDGYWPRWARAKREEEG
jgi:hypothetical protein